MQTHDVRARAWFDHAPSTSPSHASCATFEPNVATTSRSLGETTCSSESAGTAQARPQRRGRHLSFKPCVPTPTPTPTPTPLSVNAATNGMIRDEHGGAGRGGAGRGGAGRGGGGRGSSIRRMCNGPSAKGIQETSGVLVLSV
jgi:hypothetical protein